MSRSPAKRFKRPGAKYGMNELGYPGAVELCSHPENYGRQAPARPNRAAIGLALYVECSPPGAHQVKLCSRPENYGPPRNHACAREIGSGPVIAHCAGAIGNGWRGTAGHCSTVGGPTSAGLQILIARMRRELTGSGEVSSIGSLEKRNSRQSRFQSGGCQLSPRSLPVELWMKCILVQAGQTTGEWRSFASSGASASQCCTFIPVLGHLNRMGRAMTGFHVRARAPAKFRIIT